MEVAAVKLFPRESTRGSIENGGGLARALELIRRMACSSPALTVRDIAEAAGRSRRWLELEFRAHLQRSPLQEIERVRLAAARELLELTDLSILRIAGMCGFSEASGLTHFLRAHTGFSPSEYRKWAVQQRHGRGESLTPNANVAATPPEQGPAEI